MLEALEDRLAPATFTVTTGLDDGNIASPTPGSLRAAIIASNQTAGAGGPNLITFNIPAGNPSYSSTKGAWTIAPRILVEPGGSVRGRNGQSRQEPALSGIGARS